MGFGKKRKKLIPRETEENKDDDFIDPQSELVQAISR
jgi:hypothetical protein